MSMVGHAKIKTIFITECVAGFNGTNCAQGKSTIMCTGIYNIVYINTLR